MIAAVAAMFAFASCAEEPAGPATPTKLATPVLTETHTETSFTVAWEAVTNADSYVVNFDGKNYTTAECSYAFENLNAGEYTVRVKAKGAGYEDSDNAKIVVTLTGLTEVDWFTQELFVLEEPYQFEDGSVAYPYNALFFTWKGTGVADIQYGLFETAQLVGATDDAIKQSLNGFESSVLNVILADVNADGYTGVFGPGLYGLTNYTLCALVTDGNGMECLVKSEATTAEAVISDAAKAWLGSYNAKASQVIDISANAVTEQTTNFSFSVSIVEGTTDEVYVDGISILGTDTPALGQAVVDEQGNNLLAVWNYVVFSEMGEGWYLYWYALCDTKDDYYFVSGNFPAIIFVQDKQGNITTERYVGELGDGSPFEVVAFDLIGVSEGGFGIPQDQNGNKFSVWKYGDYTDITKVEATAAVANRKAVSVGQTIPASVVVAM